MKFGVMVIHNFLTIGDAVVKLDDRGLNVIQGVNEADSSTRSNGAGKSSIVDALCWCLYGVTARGVKGDAVVNNVAGKDCYVRLSIHNGETVYQVERFRKHKEHKNQLRVHSWSSTVSAVEPAPISTLTRGTDAETQKVLEKILGCSYEVFVAAVYAGQEIMPDIPRMTDRELKPLIEEAAGMQRIERAYQVSRERMNVCKADYTALDSRRIHLAHSMSTLASKISDAGNAWADFERTRRIELAELDTKILDKVEAVKFADEHLRRVTEAHDAQKDKAAGVKTAVESHKELVAEHRRLAGIASDLDRKINRAGLTMAVERIKSLEKAIADAPASVGKTCRECGKPHTVEDLEQHVATLRERLTEAREQAAKTKGQVTEQIRLFQEANRVAEEARLRIPDVSAATAVLEALSRAALAVTEALLSAERVKRELEALRVAHATKSAAINPNKLLKERLEEQLTETNAELGTVVKELTEKELKLRVAETVVKMFGPAGVRAQILDTVTPYLNARTADYLSVLSDGNIQAIWTTLTRDSKGDLKEKFSIDVSNKTGADSFSGLSGGEKRKVRLACALALQDLVASRATQPIECWIGDEIDDALDPAGLERLMTILERKARERGTVLVISHNSLTDWCDNVTTVTKKGGVSTVEGSLCE